MYLVGGYTGRQYATAILAFRPSNHAPVAARLPQGLRYAGVAALGGKVYVAGGLTTAGESRSVYVFDPRTRAVRRIATLPEAVAHAPLAVADGALYLIGGATGAGEPLSTVIRIDPASGRVRRAGTLPRPLADGAAVTLGKAIYVLGGTDPQPSRAVLRLAP